MGQQLMAVVAEGTRQRVYLAPTEGTSQAADVARPDDVPDESRPLSSTWRSGSDATA